MASLQGVDIKNNIGHKDNFYHTLEVLENVCKDSKKPLVEMGSDSA
jgi:poly(A) polymerase